MKTSSRIVRKLVAFFTGLVIVSTVYTASAQVYGPGNQGYPNGYGYNQGNGYYQGYPNGYDPRYNNGYNQGYPNPNYSYPQGGYYGNNGYGQRPNVVVVAPPYPVYSYPIVPPVIVTRPPVVIQAPRYWGAQRYSGYSRGGRGRRW